MTDITGKKQAKDQKRNRYLFDMEFPDFDIPDFEFQDFEFDFDIPDLDFEFPEIEIPDFDISDFEFPYFDIEFPDLKTAKP